MIVASRKSETVIESRNTGIETCCLVERRAPGDAGVKTVTKSMDKSKHGKNARVESSEKVKDHDQRKCYHCRKASHAKSQTRTRLKDLADAEGKPVTANTRLSSTAADAPLADDYVTTYLVTVPQFKRKSPCAHVKIETTMRSDAGSSAPTESERVRLTSAIPTCDTCAGGGICPRGSDQTAQRDNGGNAIRDGTG